MTTHTIPELADRFRAGQSFMDQAIAAKKRPLDAYKEHRDRRFQKDFVSRLRVAVRRNVARSIASSTRGRAALAERSAYLAGKYFAEYRHHYRHLQTLGKG